MQALLTLSADGPVPALNDFRALYASDLRVVELSTPPAILLLPHSQGSSPRHLGWLHGLMAVMLDYGFTNIQVVALDDNGTLTLTQNTFAIASNVDTQAMVSYFLSIGVDGVVVR